MKQYGHLKEYNVTLKTIGPVSIGSGQSFSKKEYIFKRETSTFIFLNMPFLGEICRKKGLEKKFVDFLLHPQAKDLYRFFKDNRLNENDYAKAVLYEVHSFDEHLNGHDAKEVQVFMQNGRGEFYIPGSSVKGAVRTAILTNMLLDEKGKNREKYIESIEKSLNGNIRKYQDITEPRLFNSLNVTERRSDALNSIMRGIIVSDSAPISEQDMTIVQKVDYTLGGKEKRLPLFRLCVKPQTEIKLTITFDERILARSGINAEYICTAIANQYRFNYNNFDSKFINSISREYKESKIQPLFYLGGGSGFPSKTFVTAHIYSSKSIELTGKILAAQFKPHHHEKDEDLKVSPHVRKIAVYRNKRLPMGLCRFKME